MCSHDFLRWLSIALALVSVAACGGVSVGDERASTIDPAVRSADVRDAVEPAGTPSPTDNNASQDIVVVNGWSWNVACPRSIDTLCANGGVPGTPCVSNWSSASKPSSWCAAPGISQVAILPPCKGNRVVSIFGAAPSFGAQELFLYYFYDEATGELLHVDSDGIPSVSTCVAGSSGSRYDVFGCGQPTFTDCQ